MSSESKKVLARRFLCYSWMPGPLLMLQGSRGEHRGLEQERAMGGCVL